MPKIARFFDIDVILNTNSMVWIVDKLAPNIPILKISQSEFNLIKKGIYKGQENSMKFGGSDYWVSSDFMDKIKIKSKNHQANFSNLIFSMQEFMNKGLIENLEYTLNLDNILHLKNTDDDIYFICSRNNKKNYELMIKKVEDKLKDNGLTIKNYYFISETFYNRNEDQISHKKVRLLLQHLVGLKTDGDKFTDEEIDGYDEVYFYDDEIGSINLAIDCNTLMQLLISNSESGVKLKIKDTLKSNKILYVNMVTPNKVNRFKTTKVNIEWISLIKSFEKFNWK